MRPSIRRLGRTLKTVEPTPIPRRIFTTVVQVTQGGSRDGTWQVSVQLYGGTLAAPYLSAYTNGHTPTVGDQVCVDLTGGSPLILGRVVGLPTF